MANGRTFRLNNSAKKFASPSEGAAEGGCGGNSAAPERIQTEASPAALLVESRSQQKSFLFLLPARRSLGAGGSTNSTPSRLR
ncbi:hypothetical protein A2W57_02895 [Candidatus Giovannonibacteria bacterium RIFCSPHIGHO2_02_43_16]|uniref:Uncharacterized protein n=1 Tax=Candidatus Giovannonibacteria bacterium RIFCSPHIGHO2_02_43_16 TaxID=1798331 RepID=A0A1F5WGE1_9BACT|nr:MAG: hypothetical protein A2W57_02895 [Candidatus Giovannonibacteria bacterium RIFCSPHIGHO2_02_43_16]